MEASLQDYEILYKENPDNEVAKAMKEVQVSLKRQSGGSLDINNSNASRDSDRNDAHAPQKVAAISCEEQFRNCIKAPGISPIYCVSFFVISFPSHLLYYLICVLGSSLFMQFKWFIISPSLVRL